MRLFLLLLCVGTLSSCATGYVARIGGTSIIPHESMKAVIDTDTMRLQKDELNFIPMKPGETVTLVLIRDLQTDTILLTPSSRNIRFNLTDRKIEKLSRNNHLHNTFYAHRGVVNFQLGFPHANLFRSAYGNESRSGGGFMGIALGVDCFYTNSLFLNVTGGGIMNFMLPFPAMVDFGSGVEEYHGSLYVAVSNNHMLLRNRLSLGYGLCFSHDTWNTVDYGPKDDTEPWQDASADRRSNSLGLVFRCHYYTRGTFHVGLSYRPTFVQFANGTRYKYQHTASIELGFRIRL
ncbi:hypothetical protein [Alistipes sp.]|jgi:lipoprotein|uniref:hypothetical protein n=1 Tax=Alistipes sp. TaxID=1872444 RepID=UPI0011CC010A